MKTPADFLAFMKRGIDYYSLHTTDFDILVIYIPKSFAPFRIIHCLMEDPIDERIESEGRKSKIKRITTAKMKIGLN